MVLADDRRFDLDCPASVEGDLGGFEVTPGDLRKNAEDVKELVSELPKDVLREMEEGVDHGHAELTRAVGEFCSGMTSAVAILRSSADEAGTALHGIAAEYEGNDMTQSKELARKEWGTQRPW